MTSLRRGTPLPVNQALNRPRTKFGLALPTWMAIAFVSIVIFLAGLRLVALLVFPALVAGAWLATRKHPKMFDLWGLSLGQKAHYDPRKL